MEFWGYQVLQSSGREGKDLVAAIVFSPHRVVELLDAAARARRPRARLGPNARAKARAEDVRADRRWGLSTIIEQRICLLVRFRHV